MNQFTPAQIAAIKGWTEQRDALFREIGSASTELEVITKSKTEGGLALADIQQQIAEARGRIAELDALEARLRDSVASDVSVLIERKSRLEGECAVLEERAKGASDKYAVVTMATIDIQSAHDTMKDQSAIVNRVVGEIITTSTTHTSEMKTIMDEIKTVAADVIEKGNANTANTSALMETVPVFVAKLQKSIATRRVYPKGHPNFVETEE